MEGTHDDLCNCFSNNERNWRVEDNRAFTRLVLHIVTHMVRRFDHFSWMEKLAFVKLVVYCGNGIEGFFSKTKLVKTLTGTRILYILYLTGITFNPRKIFHCIRTHFPRNAI